MNLSPQASLLSFSYKVHKKYACNYQFEVLTMQDSYQKHFPLIIKLAARFSEKNFKVP